MAARRSIDDSQEEVQRLKKKLDERDRQLKEQAVSLADMENSLVELQSLIPNDGSLHFRNRSNDSGQDPDVAQLRAAVREKNEKITALTADFDTHRADFRSTIDALEMASTETARVYEQRVEELVQEVRDLQNGSQDVESVAMQLKQLEDLVQELEEGLEDARRGEAEARGEVEFLRGEVERTRAELRREREKSAALPKAVAPAPVGKRDSRDVEQRDDEIRGLKAIIHSLSSGSTNAEADRPSIHRNGTFPTMGSADAHASVERLEREKKELQTLIERRASREEELERELERLRGVEQRASIISNGFSDRTATQDKRSSARDSKGTVVNWRGSSGRIEGPPLTPMAEMDTKSNTGSTGSGVLWCEICEMSGHDILTCGNIDRVSDTHGSNHGVVDATRTHMQKLSISSQDPDKPKPLSSFNKKAPATSPLPPPPAGAPPTMPLPNPLDGSVAAGKDGTRDPTKWCALCERDGHDSINCAFEDNFDD
jgi:DNA repair exonuclease SbcCD ATPase subunit